MKQILIILKNLFVNKYDVIEYFESKEKICTIYYIFTLIIVNLNILLYIYYT